MEDVHHLALVHVVRGVILSHRVHLGLHPGLVILLQSVAASVRDDRVEVVQNMLWLDVVADLAVRRHVEPVLLRLREVHLRALVHKVRDVVQHRLLCLLPVHHVDSTANHQHRRTHHHCPQEHPCAEHHVLCGPPLVAFHGTVAPAPQRQATVRHGKLGLSKPLSRCEGWFQQARRSTQEMKQRMRSHRNDINLTTTCQQPLARRNHTRQRASALTLPAW
eukprot:139302-Rhodomonas_salina.2